jgi:hypothetical protein
MVEARHADGEGVIDESLGLVHDGRRQILEAQPGGEFSQSNGERCLVHGA